MKTAITVLQEMMVKLGDRPQFDIVSQSGPPHERIFEVRCSARGVSASACARSKQDARQAAAAQLLQLLGDVVVSDAQRPPALPPAAAPEPPTPPTATKYVSLLAELCIEYRLAEPQYALLDGEGPAHARQWTMTATVGHLTRHATAQTKKAARQEAARLVYVHLRDTLCERTKEFSEEEALRRAHERVMERYEEQAAQRTGQAAPDLTLRISSYHTALADAYDEATRGQAVALLRSGCTKEALELLELQATQTRVASSAGPLTALRLDCWPPLAVAHSSVEGAWRQLTEALLLLLAPPA